MCYLLMDTQGLLERQEHFSINLPKGLYEVIRQREYEPRRDRLRFRKKKQQVLLAVVRGDWLRVGLAVRTDWQAVRRLVPAVYRAVGLEPPESSSPSIVPGQDCSQPRHNTDRGGRRSPSLSDC
jgi:hypothetical protein